MTVFKPVKYEYTTARGIDLEVSFTWSVSAQEMLPEDTKQKILASVDYDSLWWDVTYEYFRGNLSEDRNVAECWFGTFDDTKTYVLTKEGGDLSQLGDFVCYGEATVTITLKGFKTHHKEIR